jgi:cytochrome c-type biogenesis protein CcmH/NrfG
MFANGGKTMAYKSLLVTLIAGLVLATGAWAAGSSSSSSTPRISKNDTYDKAVRAVNGGDYQRAATLLRDVVASDARNADAWNYLGFSNRKLKHYDDALAAYQRALAIDPDHRGANEYLGELYLDMKNLPKAKERLQRLDAVCTFGCEEYDDLKAAIEAHETS